MIPPNADVEQLKEIQADGVLAAQRLYDLSRERIHADNLKFVGGAFKYRNSYGEGGKDWTLYGLVKRDEDGQLYAFTFERDCYGDVSIKPDTPIDLDSWVPCDPGEFEAEWTKVLSALSALQPR